MLVDGLDVVIDGWPLRVWLAVDRARAEGVLLTDVEINQLTALGTPRSVRRDALIALNLNGVHSARKVANARQRLAEYINGNRVAR